MQQHELNGKTLCLIDKKLIPQLVDISPGGITGINDYHLSNGQFVTCRKSELKNAIIKTVDGLPPGDWKFFATTDTITEEQAAELVECFGRGRWRNYAFISQYSELLLPTAKESFQSWLTANNISGNNAILIKQ